MKTRNQTQRQARNCQQTKLKTPIQPRSLSDSCSSSAGPGEPRKKRKSLPASMPRKGKQQSLPANMPKKGKQQARHDWTPAKNKQLWEFAKELRAMWPHKMKFYTTLAAKMNEQFQKDGYVTLDAIKVKDKFTNFHARYALYLEGKAPEDDTLYSEYGDTMSSYFTSGAGTSSGSVSVGGSSKTRKKMSRQGDHGNALAYLISNKIEGAILSEYSALLRFADVLDPFFQFKDFEAKIKFLNSCLAARANANVPPGM